MANSDDTPSPSPDERVIVAKRDLGAALDDWPEYVLPGIDRPDDVTDDDPLDLRLAFEPRSDLGNARRLAARFGSDIRWVKDVGWHGWDGTRWNREDGDAMVALLADKVSEAISGEADALEIYLVAKLAKEEADSDRPMTAKEYDRRLEEIDKQVGAHRKFGIGTGNLARTRAMIEKAQPYHRVRIDDFDAKPWLFNVRNGTVELLRPGHPGTANDVRWRFREHRREDLLTRMAGVVFDDKAACPVWERFLMEVLPEKPVRHFLARWFGYKMSGDMRAQKIVMLTGKAQRNGSNGKSTMVEALETLMGDYWMRLPIESLLGGQQRRGEGPSPDLIELPGKRFVVAVEPESGASLSTSAIKTLTEPTTMKARQLNMPFVTFTPQHRLTLMFNDAPSVPASDDGTWRRVIRVLFCERFVPADEMDRPENAGARAIDYTLPERLREPEELSGILLWLLAGWSDFCEAGLSPPPEVVEATKAYRAENDTVGEFLSGACTLDDDQASETGAALRFAYEKWCKGSGYNPLGPKKFGLELKKKLHSVTCGVVKYYGVRLKWEFAPKGDDL